MAKNKNLKPQPLLKENLAFSDLNLGSPEISAVTQRESRNCSTLQVNSSEKKYTLYLVEMNFYITLQSCYCVPFKEIYLMLRI